MKYDQLRWFDSCFFMKRRKERSEEGRGGEKGDPYATLITQYPTTHLMYLVSACEASECQSS